MMDITKWELNNLNVYLNHIINGLLREQLVDDFFQYGNTKFMKNYFSEANEPGIILQPNRLGFELFYCAYGLGKEDVNTFFDLDKTFEIDEKVNIDNGIIRIE